MTSFSTESLGFQSLPAGIRWRGPQMSWAIDGSQMYLPDPRPRRQESRGPSAAVWIVQADQLAAESHEPEHSRPTARARPGDLDGDLGRLTRFSRQGVEGRKPYDGHVRLSDLSKGE
jgi:hypothetical protein